MDPWPLFVRRFGKEWRNIQTTTFFFSKDSSMDKHPSTPSVSHHFFER